jgi:hypothetical protein
MIVKRNKTGQINIYIDEALKEAAMRAAAADHRSLTTLIEVLLTRHCQQHGFLPAASSKPKRAKS